MFVNILLVAIVMLTALLLFAVLLVQKRKPRPSPGHKFMAIPGGDTVVFGDSKPGDTVNIAGLDIQIVDEAEAEAQEDSLVCCMTKKSYDAQKFKPFDNNKEGPCADCGETVVWRPHMPDSIPKVCMSCVVSRLGEED
jgi:hypothetical protein